MMIKLYMIWGKKCVHLLSKFAKFYTLGLQGKKRAFDQYKVVLQPELNLVSQKCVTTIGLLNNSPQACKTL